MARIYQARQLQRRRQFHVYVSLNWPTIYAPGSPLCCMLSMGEGDVCIGRTCEASLPEMNTLVWTWSGVLPRGVKDKKQHSQISTHS